MTRQRLGHWGIQGVGIIGDVELVYFPQGSIVELERDVMESATSLVTIVS